MARTKRDPKTKEDILNRMLSYDFDGDIRHLGAETASITRISAHTLRLTFPATGTVFDVSIHRPREFAKPRAPEARSFKQATAPRQEQPQEQLTRGQKAARTRAARRAAASSGADREATH